MNLFPVARGLVNCQIHRFDRRLIVGKYAPVAESVSVAHAAESLGIRANLLYRWKQQIDDEQAGTRLTGDERAELLRLRKENKRLLLEKDILKKASAFFAKEMK